MAKKNVTKQSPIKHNGLDFLGSSDMGKLIKTFDWSKTTLGDISAWPISMRTAISIALHSPMPIIMLWGKDGIIIYNDAYTVFAGAKQPSLLGSYVKDGWSEAANFIDKFLKKVLSGEQLVFKDQEFIVQRNFVDEHVWLDLTYSPIINEIGETTGVFVIVVETTQQVISEQKQKKAEDTLKAKQKHLYDLFMHAPAAIAIISGPELVFTLANKPYLQLVGRKESLVGKPLLKAIPELEPSLIKIIRNVAFKGERFIANEMPVKIDWGNNGKLYTKYLNFIYEPVYEDDKPNGLMAFVYDVTAQVKNRQQVEQSEERFRTLFEKSTDAIQLVDTEGKIIYSSESIKNVLGYSSEELQGSGISPYLHPEDTDYFYRKFTELIKNPNKPVVMQYRVKHKDGTWAWLETTGVNHLKTPYIQALVGTFRNITERKLAQAATQEQLMVTKAITDIATACLFMIDMNGIVTFMNPAAQKITGYTSEEAIGKPMHSLVHHSHPDGTPYPDKDCPLVQTYKHGKSNPLHEDIFFKKDGSAFNALIIGTPIHSENRQAGTVVEFRDITEEKRAEKELRELISITEQRNALMRINKTKDEFIGLASHQLRTPATAVKQYIAILLDDMLGPLSSDQKKYLKIAYDNNERELSIINDLLKTAQMTSSEYSLNKHPYNILKLIEECIADLETMFTMRNQTISIKKPSKIINAHIDKGELKLALINLLENASKYSYPGTGIKVTIIPGNEFVEIAISDKGVGISKDDQRRIFDKFTRVDNELSDTVTGNGLGLYWVKQVVKLHNGTIKLKSILGNGSKFIIRLPL